MERGQFISSYIIFDVRSLRVNFKYGFVLYGIIMSKIDEVNLELFYHVLEQLAGDEIHFVYLSFNKYTMFKQYMGDNLVWLWRINDVNVYELGNFIIFENRTPPFDAIITKGICVKTLKFKQVLECLKGHLGLNIH